MHPDFIPVGPATGADMRAIIEFHHHTGYLLVGVEQAELAVYALYFCTHCSHRFRVELETAAAMEFRCPKCQRPSMRDIVRRINWRRKISLSMIMASAGYVIGRLIIYLAT